MSAQIIGWRVSWSVVNRIGFREHHFKVFDVHEKQAAVKLKRDREADGIKVEFEPLHPDGGIVTNWEGNK